MTYSKVCVLISTLISLSCFAANAGNTIKVYKWVDASGVTHFDQTPPTSTPKEILKITKTTSSAAPTDAASGSSPASAPKTDKPATAKTDKPAGAGNQVKDKENCDVAKKNADILKNYSRIKVMDEKGEYRYLSEEEKQQRITESDKMMQDNCE